jgi:hypothetical protein
VQLHGKGEAGLARHIAVPCIAVVHVAQHAKGGSVASRPQVQ